MYLHSVVVGIINIIQHACCFTQNTQFNYKGQGSKRRPTTQNVMFIFEKKEFRMLECSLME